MGAPKHVQTLRSDSAQISTANTNRDGTGTIGTIFTGVAAGSVLQQIVITRQGSTTAGCIRLWIYNGSAYRLWFEIVVPPITVAVGTPGVPVWNWKWSGERNLASASYSLRASTHIGEAFDITCDGGDFA